MYALWLERVQEPMIVCSPGMDLQAVVTEEPVGPPGPWRRGFPDLDDHDVETAARSAPLLGALLLGTTNASWALRDPQAPTDAPISDAFVGFWSATTADLTAIGCQVIDALSASYGRPPLLLTVQDT